MILLAYAVYFALIALVVSWWRVEARASAGTRARVGIALIVLLPFVAAGGWTAAFVQDQVVLEQGILIVVLGGLTLVIGSVPPFVKLPNAGLALRLAGWGVVAGFFLIPASTALLAPIGGLLAFLVPHAGRRNLQPAVRAD